MVLQAASGDSAAALERLCRTYWYPLYAFVRRQGHDVHDALEESANLPAPEIIARKSPMIWKPPANNSPRLRRI
jgi:hypothetical protein